MQLQIQGCEVRERVKVQYIPVYRVQLVRERNIKTDNRSIDNPVKAAEILKNYIGETDREMFVVAMLDTKNKVIGINTVSIGSLNSSIVHPREVLKPAILSNSAGIIISHNHPSGDPTPSREDLDITKRLVDACELIGIKLLDHIVIGDEYLSFKEKGLI